MVRGLGGSDRFFPFLPPIRKLANLRDHRLEPSFDLNPFGPTPVQVLTPSTPVPVPVGSC
jgi:hypothetical protein